MRTLSSNGVKTPGQEWYGLDASQIVYPKVASCVTVTCVVTGGLAGLHLASMPKQRETDTDIATYGKIAKGATAMYVVGMLSHRWTPPNVKNQTGLTYGSASGGTLIARLRQATGFAGVVYVNDTSTLGTDLKITASLASNVVAFTYDDDSGARPLTTFQHVVGHAMLQPQQQPGSCNIL